MQAAPTIALLHPFHLAGSQPDNRDVTDLFVFGVDGTDDSGVDEEVGEFGSVSRSLDYKKPDSDSNLGEIISILQITRTSRQDSK
jgi:hypothetical protein